ncbi:HSP20-like chaperone, partial [Plectosphaerella plurivora]
VLWAQRSSTSDASKNFIYMTITVPDVPASNLKLDIKSQSVSFEGHSDSLKRTYKLDVELYGEIDPAESKTLHTGKNIQLKLQKKELKEEYWPRLLKESKKVHYLKTDFDKWVDEDEQDEAPEEDFSQFGGMGGMPGMGGGTWPKNPFDQNST